MFWVQEPYYPAPFWLTPAGSLGFVLRNTAFTLDTDAVASEGAITYSKVSGPAWVNVDAGTGEVSGTAPDTEASFDVTLRASAAGKSADRTFSIDVITNPCLSGAATPGDICPDATIYIRSDLFITATNDATGNSTWYAGVDNCANSTQHGHTDWDLPTLVELHDMLAITTTIGNLDG